MSEDIKAVEEQKVDTKVETKATETVEKPAAETVGSILKDRTEPREDKAIPEAAFLAEKKARKAAERDLAALKRSIEDGATPAEVSADIDAIGEKYDIKPAFLKELAGVIRKDVEKDVDERVASKMRPVEEASKADRIEKVFNTHFDRAMDEMPEFKGIVSKSVIKSLSLDSANQNKTFAQLIEETYGNALGGKRTLETTTPRGGKSDGSVDVDRAQKDPKYYDEVMKDPEMKKQYNSDLIDRIAQSL